MLYRHKDFSETLVHQCADADFYILAHRQEIANVRVHDISAYLSVPVRDYNCSASKKGGLLRDGYPAIRHETVSITHCPFCGVKLDTDTRTNDFLDMKLL